MLIGALLAVGMPSLAGPVSGHLAAKGSHLGGGTSVEELPPSGGSVGHCLD